MGLDMYLTGQRYHFNPAQPRQNGDLECEEYQLGYWRKHPNLHGYIVQHFADGIDDCRVIKLSSNGVTQIIEAIQQRELPHTDGFFFGISEDSKEQRKEDIALFEDALRWLEIKEPNIIRSICYRASW